MLSFPSWRRVLPVAQFCLFLTGIRLGCPYVDLAIDEWLHPPDPASFTFRPDFIDGTPSNWEQVALGVNLPVCWPTAILVATAGGFLPDLQQSGRIAELTRHTMEALAIPLFWYWLGARLDRRSNTHHSRPAAWARTAIGAFELLAWALATTAASITPIGYLTGKDSAMPLFALFAAAWLTFAALALRHLRKAPNPPTAAARSSTESSPPAPAPAADHSQPGTDAAPPDQQ